MRNTFARVTEIAGKKKKCMFAVRDIGNRMFDNYKEIANELLNCGILKQT